MNDHAAREILASKRGMNTRYFFLAVLGFAISMGAPAHGRNVGLMIPIAEALAAAFVSDRPTGAVKFFFADQKSPEVIKHLGTYHAGPRSGAAARSDQRA